MHGLADDLRCALKADSVSLVIVGEFCSEHHEMCLG